MNNLFLDEQDNDFNNFKLFGKKIDSFADVFRSKAKVECIDDAKAGGSSKGDARKDCRKELGGNILVRGTKVVSLSVPRGAFLTLVRLNYRGLASRMARAKFSDPNVYKSAIQKFIQLGGGQGKFESAINFGKNKKPFICGAKCKAKVNFSGDNDFSQDELVFFEQEPDFAYSNLEPTITIAVIGLASAVAVPIINIIKDVKMTSAEREADEREAEQSEELRQDQMESQEAQFEEDEKKRVATESLVKKGLIGGTILVVVLITGAIIMKVVRKKRGK